MTKYRVNVVIKGSIEVEAPEEGMAQESIRWMDSSFIMDDPTFSVESYYGEDAVPVENDDVRPWDTDPTLSYGFCPICGDNDCQGKYDEIDCRFWEERTSDWVDDAATGSEQFGIDEGE